MEKEEEERRKKWRGLVRCSRYVSLTSQHALARYSPNRSSGLTEKKRRDMTPIARYLSRLFLPFALSPCQSALSRPYSLFLVSQSPARHALGVVAGMRINCTLQLLSRQRPCRFSLPLPPPSLCLLSSRRRVRVRLHDRTPVSLCVRTRLYTLAGARRKFIGPLGKSLTLPRI